MLKRHPANNDWSSDALPFVGYVPRSVAAGKRVMDVLGALAALVVTAPLWLLIALAIKIDSRGPIFDRQTRVGRAMADRTELFGRLKFRSTSVGTEVRTGVGLILRKTRLDELPQLLNVLKGDMSLIGPRPEQPRFYRRLNQIASFADRTVGLRPGVTGLPQIRWDYDSSDADIVRTFRYAAAYSRQLSDWRSWISSDLRIVLCVLGAIANGATH